MFRDFPKMLHFGKMQHFSTPQGTVKVRKFKMTCAENPPPSILKQDGLCTQGLYCSNQS